jgi:uncharacterized membrane protein YgcG
MKKKGFLLVMLALALTFSFILAGCENPTGNKNNNNDENESDAKTELPANASFDEVIAKLDAIIAHPDTPAATKVSAGELKTQLNTDASTLRPAWSSVGASYITVINGLIDTISSDNSDDDDDDDDKDGSKPSDNGGDDGGNSDGNNGDNGGDGDGSGGGSKPTALSASASFDDVITKLDAIIAYADTPAAEKAQAEELKSQLNANASSFRAVWSSVGGSYVTTINALIDTIPSGNGGNGDGGNSNGGNGDGGDSGGGNGGGDSDNGDNGNSDNTNPEASSDANLGSLSISAGTLSPAFNASTTSYTVSVPNTTTSITVTAAVADTGKATPAQSPGTLGSPVSLNVGTNTITVTVTAEDETTKPYTITVTRAAAMVTNSVTVTITKANEVINLETSSLDDLSKKNGDALIITAPAGYDDYDYQVDGVTVISDREIEISAESYGLGIHSVLLIFYKNEIQYGSEVTFKVVK